MPAAKTNGFPNAQRWVDEIDRHEAEIDALRMEHAARVATVRKLQRGVKDAAKEDGISTKVFNAILLERKHLKNAAKVRDKLEDDDLAAEAEMVRERLSPVADLPLFGAAIDAAESAVVKRGKRGAAAVGSILDDDADVRPGFLKPSPDDVAAAENAAALAGLKGLN